MTIACLLLELLKSVILYDIKLNTVACFFVFCFFLNKSSLPAVAIGEMFASALFDGDLEQSSLSAPTGVKLV